jgi:hypothetical protein
LHSGFLDSQKMVVGGESKPVGGQVEDLSPKGEAPTTGYLLQVNTGSLLGA